MSDEQAQQQDQQQQQQQQQEQQAFDRDVYYAELKELQILDFALVELNLYLNTHPGDLQAIQQFNQLAQKRKGVAQQFEMQYGPLVNFGNSYSRYPWQWNETPWPWQV